MWVVYSLDPEVDLKQNDIRRRLILHARDQHKFNTVHKEQEQKIESEFEKQVFNILIKIFSFKLMLLITLFILHLCFFKLI